MKPDSLHPLTLLEAFPSSPAAHRATLEAQVEQWFAAYSAGNEELFATPARIARRDQDAPRSAAVEEAISWTIVPNTDRKIPESGQ